MINSAHATPREAHASLRSEIFNDPVLKRALAAARDQQAAYFPGAGNLGDALIQLGTLELFDHLAWQPRVLLGLSPDTLSDATTVVMGGGGGWIEGQYEFYPQVLTPFLEQGGTLIVLPSTIYGYEGFFRKYAKQVRIFCRENGTFQRLSRVSELAGRLHLTHDLSFAVDPRTFADLGEKTGNGTLNLFRQDGESTQKTWPEGNLDLSLVLNGIQWNDREMCLRPLRAAAELISQFAQVRTDRLHMAILSTMLGRRVEMHPNSYFKNKGVFDMSLSHFSQVSFIEAPPQITSAVANARQEALVGRLSQEVAELRAKVLEYATEIDRMNGLDMHRAEPFMPLAFQQSRGYRLWRRYIAVYNLPVAGRALRAARRVFGAALKAIRR